MQAEMLQSCIQFYIPAQYVQKSLAEFPQNILCPFDMLFLCGEHVNHYFCLGLIAE